MFSIEGGVPVVVPASPWRIGDWLYLHGAARPRLHARFSGGDSLCVSMALVDGLVLARSALRHSLDYRSVVLFGCGEAVAEPAMSTAPVLPPWLEAPRKAGAPAGADET